MVTVVDILGSSALYCCIFCEIRVIATEKKEESEHDISYGSSRPLSIWPQPMHVEQVPQE
jgi:hypothetical protein